MLFIKVPSNALFMDMPHAILRVYIRLIQQHFLYCHGDFTKEFYITDRDLADLCFCSTDTIKRAKRFLSTFELLEYHIGPKNKTFYKIIPDGGLGK